MGLVPSDTDYRMFSYATLGKWPGIDVAFILDSATYHTSRDKLQRLQHGACQVRRRQAVGVQCADTLLQRLWAPCSAVPRHASLCSGCMHATLHPCKRGLARCRTKGACGVHAASQYICSTGCGQHAQLHGNCNTSCRLHACCTAVSLGTLLPMNQTCCDCCSWKTACSAQGGHSARLVFLHAPLEIKSCCCCS